MNRLMMIAACALATACGGGSSSGSGTDARVLDAASPAPDAAAALPNISDAIDCRFDTPVGAGGGALQKHTIDLTRFPDALCNDGTTAVLHFRPFRGDSNRNRWVIALRGGGGCGSAASCVARYCGCSSRRAGDCPFVDPAQYTRFTADNMTGNSPPRKVATGIYLRDGGSSQTNPIENYNQIRLTYCSSDSWRGTGRDVPMNALHPVTGVPVDFSMHFLGSRILDASIATLRRDGVPALVHSLGASVELPDLDEAVEVIFAGDSGGGAGVINNLDRLAADLRANNVACVGDGACALSVHGLIDAIVGPDVARLDFTGSGLADYDAFTTLLESGEALQVARLDASCTAWHTTNSPGTAGYCNDTNHVVRHHITTPFFVRMALSDSLISEPYVDLSDPVLGPVTTSVFAQLLSAELSAFPSLASTAEEGGEFTQAPGVFAPGCSKHDTIFDNAQVYGVSITPPGGTAARLFDVFGPWLLGGPGVAVVATGPAQTVCP